MRRRLTFRDVFSIVTGACFRFAIPAVAFGAHRLRDRTAPRPRTVTLETHNKLKGMIALRKGGMNEGMKDWLLDWINGQMSGRLNELMNGLTNAWKKRFIDA